MSGSIRPVLLSALTVLAIGGLAAPAGAADGISTAGQPGSVALVGIASANHQRDLAAPPAGSCTLGGWNASWPAGTKVAITYTSEVACGTGLVVTTSVTSTLHSAGGAVEQVAPNAHGDTPGTFASSATSQKFARPTTHYVQHQSTSTLHPSSAGTLVWGALPAGCTGTNTATATCNINEPAFTV